VFTIAHICTYRGLKNPIFVLVPRLVGSGRLFKVCGVKLMLGKLVFPSFSRNLKLLGETFLSETVEVIDRLLVWLICGEVLHIRHECDQVSTFLDRKLLNELNEYFSVLAGVRGSRIP
jgi:hypothetical protein